MSLTRQREDAPRTRSADGRPGRGASRWHRRRRDIRSLVLRRIAVGVPMLVAVSAGVFILAANSPFNPLASYLGSRYQQATEAQKQSMSNELGFEDSWWHSWMTWVGDLVHGDLGWSRVYSMPVSEVFASRLGWTVLLSACGLILAVVAALIIGTTAGLRPGSVIDRACSALAVVLQSMPPFVVALTGVALFSVILRWAPPGGAAPPGGSYTVGTVMTHIVLPSCALAVSQAPWLLLSVRASVARAVVSDPVRSARARARPAAHAASQ